MILPGTTLVLNRIVPALSSQVHICLLRLLMVLKCSSFSSNFSYSHTTGISVPVDHSEFADLSGMKAKEQIRKMA